MFHDDDFYSYKDVVIEPGVLYIENSTIFKNNSRSTVGDLRFATASVPLVVTVGSVSV